jgi:excisionase family DNA binding protein
MRRRPKETRTKEDAKLAIGGPLTFQVTLEGSLTLSSLREVAVQLEIASADGLQAPKERVALAGPKLGYSIGEITKMLPVSRSTLYEQIKSGALVARKIAGRRTVILRDDLERWITDRRGASA